MMVVGSKHFFSGQPDQGSRDRQHSRGAKWRWIRRDRASGSKGTRMSGTKGSEGGCVTIALGPAGDCGVLRASSCMMLQNILLELFGLVVVMLCIPQLQTPYFIKSLGSAALASLNCFHTLSLPSGTHSLARFSCSVQKLNLHYKATRALLAG